MLHKIILSTTIKKTMYENSQSHKDLQNENPNSLIGRLIYKYHIRFFTLKPQIEKGMFNLIEE